jgi:type VII secretion protein EssC, C-terminal domain
VGDRYRIILTGKNLYKEAELLPEMKEFRIGTAMECDLRLRREQYFEPVELTLVRNGDVWTVLCANNLFLNIGDARKLFTMQLEHGYVFRVCYQSSGSELLSVEFLIDFENESKKLNRRIDVSALQYFSIGVGGNNQIVLNSKYLRRDEISCIQANGALTITVSNTTYGIYVNGRKMMSGVTVQSGDFFSLSDAVFYYSGGYLWTDNSDVVRTALPVYVDTRGDEYPLFHRNTRVKVVPSEEKIEILDPPQKPEKPKANLFQRLFPSLGMLIAAGIMAYMGGATMLIFSGISALMAIITAVVGIIQGKKEFKEKTKERIEKYEAYIEGKREEITKARDEERRTLEAIYCSENENINRLTHFSCDLFDRNREDADFLCVRLGTGAVEAKQKIDYKKQERLEIEDDLQKKPEEISEEFHNVDCAPVICNLKKSNAVGVIGPEEARQAMLNRMILDIAARHYYSDVKMFFIASSNHSDLVWRYRMLPFVWNDVLHTRNIVCNETSKDLIFEFLYKELSYRDQNKEHDSHFIIFVLDDCGLKTHPISKFIDKAKDLDVTFVFFAQNRAEIAQGCAYLISLADPYNGVIVDTSDRNKETKFVCAEIGQDLVDSLVTLLAPVYTEEISLEGSLTRNITLFQLLNIFTVDDLDLKMRWNRSQVFKTMAAPIGVSKTGIVSLDLHDKAHGPHGLVAGTTGSGKSELLQTYILSMATLFHPYEVGFVIIDFKGGGMVNQFRQLPHLLGAITNIDGRAINRSLKSIKAELQKRQRLFADADVNHIDKYIQKYKMGEVQEALPHLIIIVDEFAELKAEQPEFMKELISAARIGRSLGVHLILATQKPSGQVNEQIWSNSRFKLCLKVQSQEDSNEVLKSPLAAEIKEPGRAYLQVGNNEIFELFQSAYSGASEKTDDASIKEFTIYSLLDTGRREPVYSQKRQKNGEQNSTQLDAIVKYVAEYCNKENVTKLADICLPELGQSIVFPHKEELLPKENSIVVEIGIYDDPDNQRQGVCSVNLTSENLMIIGSAQSGKTNMLQTIIRSISTKYSTDEVVIYIIDFASMILKSFEQMNHVGGVVTSSEDEKLKNLMKLLFSEIETRKEKLLTYGLSSFAAYREAGLTELPQIVLLIDNITALKELYFRDNDDELINLCREGLTVGISVVVANSQTAGIGYKYLSSFSSRIAMFCNDSSEYSALFDHCSERIDDIRGRCIIEVDKVHLECQTFLAFEGEKEIDRVGSVRQYIAECNAINPRGMTSIIPVIPEVIDSDYVITNHSIRMKAEGKVVLGLDYADVMPFVVDIKSLGVLAVSGRENAGRHNFIKSIVKMCELVHPGSTEVYIIDGIRRRLFSLKDDANVFSYDCVQEKAVFLVKEICSELKYRYDALATGDDSVLNDSKTLLLILDNYDAVEAICNDPMALSAYKDITGKYKNMNVCVILGGFENESVSYSAPEIYKKARDARHFMFFDDLVNLKIFDMSLTVVRQYKKPIELGDGYYIKDNNCQKIKTVLCV